MGWYDSLSFFLSFAEKKVWYIKRYGRVLIVDGAKAFEKRERHRGVPTVR